MHPILFQIGNFKIYSYGVMVALGFLAAVYLTGAEAKRRGISPGKIFDIYLYVMIFGIIGARLLHVILDIGYYAGHPLDIIMINRGGLAFQGGLVFGIIAAIIAIKKSGLSILNTADMMIPYVALAQSIGRIGCFLNGCCYGISDLYPTQIYLSVFFLAMFVILKKIYEGATTGGIVFTWYLLLFSSGSFFLDFLRGDLEIVFFNLRVSQLISAVIFLLGLFMLAGLRWKTIHLR
ncbi:MAG: prolipoprotein diacylglyceryl transferase [Candidatus Omnitrophota bacterium]|nr:prolipoprotein diacylglyceryl transferase [Candidatus Omnitrophota bacterium]